MIRFFVQGLPKSMSVSSSVAFKRNGVKHSCQKRAHTEWATLVGHIGRQHAPERPLAGPVALHVTFRMPRPTSAGACSAVR